MLFLILQKKASPTKALFSNDGKKIIGYAVKILYNVICMQYIFHKARPRHVFEKKIIILT